MHVNNSYRPWTFFSSFYRLSPPLTLLFNYESNNNYKYVYFSFYSSLLSQPALIHAGVPRAKVVCSAQSCSTSSSTMSGSRSIRISAFTSIPNQLPTVALAASTFSSASEARGEALRPSSCSSPTRCSSGLSSTTCRLLLSQWATTPTTAREVATNRRPHCHALADAHLHRDDVRQSRTAPDSKPGLRLCDEVRSSITVARKYGYEREHFQSIPLKLFPSFIHSFYSSLRFSSLSEHIVYQ